MSATYNVSDIEIEEPPSIYDRDAKNKAEELNRKNLYVNFFLSFTQAANLAKVMKI